MSEQNKMTEEEYLKKHLGSLESKNQNVTNSDIPFVEQPKIDSTRTTDLQYFNFDVKEMPCGLFYPSGTVIMVRPAQVKEIQSYSMVDDNNFYDIVEKYGAVSDDEKIKELGDIIDDVMKDENAFKATEKKNVKLIEFKFLLLYVPYAVNPVGDDAYV